MSAVFSSHSVGIKFLLAISWLPGLSFAEEANSEATSATQAPKTTTLTAAESVSEALPEESPWPWQGRRLASRGIGGFWSPASTLGTPAGLALARQSYGNVGRVYGASLAQLEIGRGLGLHSEGYTIFNLLEMQGPISLLLGGNPLELAADLNTKNDSRDHASWTTHADLGLRIGDKESCFASMGGGVGLNSGTQSRGGRGDWFRTETGAMFSAVCGPVSIGATLRNVDDIEGTVAHATASAVVFLVGEKRKFGLGAALSVTGYDEGSEYHHLLSRPLLAYQVEERQTLFRITFQTSLEPNDE